MLRGVARLRSGKEPTVTIEAKAWLTSLACGKAKELGYPRELWNDAASCPARTRAWPAEEYCLANLAQSALEEGCIEEQAEQPERCGGHHSYDENLGCPGDRDDVPARLAPELHVRASSRATMKGRVLMLPRSGALSAPMPKGCATCTA
jgi:hypothetical protein